MNLTSTGSIKFKQKDKIAFKRVFSPSVGGYVWSSETFDGEYLSRRYALESVAILKLKLHREDLRWVSDITLESCLNNEGCVVQFEEATWGR